jgi:hypothetical protein
MNGKLKMALHLIIHLANQHNWPLGAVKLAKSVVLSEVSSLYWFYKPIIGVKAVKAPRGPVPDGLAEALRQLAAEGLIKITEGEELYEPTSYESLAPPDLTLLSGEEQRIITEITEVCCKKYTAAALSDLTHNWYWKTVKMGDEIPLTAYLRNEDESPEPSPLTEDELAQIDQAMTAGEFNA